MSEIIPASIQKQAMLQQSPADAQAFLKTLAATSLTNRAGYIADTDERTVVEASQALGRWAVTSISGESILVELDDIIERLGAKAFPMNPYIIHYRYILSQGAKRWAFFEEYQLLCQTHRWLPLRQKVLERLRTPHPKDFARWVWLRTRGAFSTARINGIEYPVVFDKRPD
jgi:hypothetical protein